MYQALDLEEVTGYFSRTVAELDSSAEKLDDRMQPLLDSQCGAVVKSTDRNVGGGDGVVLPLSAPRV